jgi:cytochrome c oxidase subunit IV
MAKAAQDTEHHIIPFDVYVKIFGALIGLTVITVLAAQFDFGAMNIIVAFGIATVKAVLVLAYFMHLKYDNMMNRVIMASAFFFLLVLFLFAWLDDATRVVQSSTL